MSRVCLFPSEMSWPNEPPKGRRPWKGRGYPYNNLHNRHFPDVHNSGSFPFPFHIWRIEYPSFIPLFIQPFSPPSSRRLFIQEYRLPGYKRAGTGADKFFLTHPLFISIHSNFNPGKKSSFPRKRESKKTGFRAKPGMTNPI